MGYILTQIARFWETMVIGTGEHLSLSVAGIFFFGFPVAFSLSAYVFAILMTQNIAMWLAVLAAILSSVVVGVVFAIFYRRLSNDSFAVFTFASVLAFIALVSSWDSLTGGVLGIPGVPRPAFISSFISLVVFQGIIAVIFLIGEFFILKSPFGRALQAHKESKIYLDSLGTNSYHVGSIAIILASLASGVSGLVTIWRIQFLDPTLGGITLLLQVLTIVIIATKPDIGSIIIATLIIVLLPEVLRFFPFPSSIVGDLRLLFYSISLIFLVNRVSSKYTPEKRFV